MTGSGFYPKVDGDIYYAYDVNQTFNSLGNVIRDKLSLPSINSSIMSSITLIGSTNIINTAGSISPYFSGTQFNYVIDDFNDDVVGNLWTSGAQSTSLTSWSVTESGTQVQLAMTQHDADGSVWLVAGSNIFDTYGNYFRVKTLASTITQGPSPGASRLSVYLGFGSIVQNAVWTKASTSSNPVDIDFFRTNINEVYCRSFESGGTWSDWTGGVIGSGRIGFIANFDDASDNTSCDYKIDFVKCLSGTVPCGFIVDVGSFANRYTGSHNFTGIIAEGEYVGNYISGGVTNNYSFNNGANYSAGSFGKLVGVSNAGSYYKYQYIGSQTYTSGVSSGFILTKLGFICV